MSAWYMFLMCVEMRIPMESTRGKLESVFLYLR